MCTKGADKAGGNTSLQLIWVKWDPLINDMIYADFYDYADNRHEAEIAEWAISQLTGALDAETTFTVNNFTVQASTRCSLK